MVITPSSGWVSGSSWYGWKTLGKIFPTPPSLRGFNFVWVSSTLKKLGCWITDSPIRIWEGQSCIFLTQLFYFVLGSKLGSKLILFISRFSSNKLGFWEKRKEEEKTEEEARTFKMVEVHLVEIVEGDIYQGICVLLMSG